MTESIATGAAGPTPPRPPAVGGRTADRGPPSIPSIVDPRWDLVWFVGPGVVSLVVAFLLAAQPATDAVSLAARDEWIWIACVLAIDVAHVWASLYRTYLDESAWAHHRVRLLWTPALLLWFGALVHIASPAAFWRVLAYVAVFHFIKQHEGFAMLYLRAGERRSAQASRPPALEPSRAKWLVKGAIWAGTAGPIVAWHAALPRRFAWFLDGDFVQGLPAFIGPFALAIAAVPVCAFVWWRVVELRRGAANPLLTAVVLLPGINWTTGMVLFDDDAIFTVTNVVMHGVPYLALVWRTGGQESLTRWLVRSSRADGDRDGDAPAETVVGADTGTGGASTGPLPPWIVALIFYGSLLLLAVGEEALWDRWIWHDRPWLFGAASEGAPARHPVTTSLLVALLSLPQATHYVLDRYIWRVGPLNPNLADQLGFGSPPRPPATRMTTHPAVSAET